MAMFDDNFNFEIHPSSSLAMFDDNFNFEIQRSPSLASSIKSSTSIPELSRAVSPCSSVNSYSTSSSFSVTDLAATFANSRLQSESQICYDSCQSYANLDDDEASWAIPSPTELTPLLHLLDLPSRPNSSSDRAQRLAHTRLLCTGDHARDISALVARMIDCGDQCAVVSTERPCSAMSEEDGHCTSRGTTALPSAPKPSALALAHARFGFRRTTEPTTTATDACISKPARRTKSSRSHRNRIWIPKRS